MKQVWITRAGAPEVLELREAADPEPGADEVRAPRYDHLTYDILPGEQVVVRKPDVLIVDILLPGIDGATLITSLRSHPQFRRSRLIVITSLDEAQREPYAFALADVPVVHKPELVAQLPGLLADALGTAASPTA